MTVRSALVTGASRGIGRSIAEVLARQGYSLTISARSLSKLDEVAESLRELGSPFVQTRIADMANEIEIWRLSSAHRDQFTTMNTLVLNAGVGMAAPIESTPLYRLDKTFSVNMRAPFQLLQQCMPMLRAAALEDSSRGAKVVALSSITGAFAEPNLGAYGASKAALLSLAESVNAEEAPNGVTATAIAPGYVDTDMSAWTHDVIPSTQMIPVEDIALLVNALVSMSSRSMISRVVVARSSSDGRQA